MFKKRKKEVFLAVATTVLACVLGLILIEGYYWRSGYTSLVCEICQFHPELGWENIPDKTVTNGKVTYTTNSMGMRSEEVDSLRDHVLIVGDSVAFGLGVNNDETVSHFLEKAQPEYQVLNLGVSGYGIGQYYLNLKRHIDKLKPTMFVVILYTSNDLTETRQDNRYGISKPFFRYENERLLNLNPEISQYSCLNLHTRLRYAKHLIPLSMIESCRPRFIERDNAKPTIAKLIDEIRSLGIQRNIPTLFVLSPALPAVESVACKKSRPLGACLNHDQGFEAFYRYFHEIMQDQNIPYIDFLNHLIDNEKEIRSLYVNNGEDIHHFSPKGNAMLAKAITKRLDLLKTESIP
jgi:lysophospholipase L1-like esterase